MEEFKDNLSKMLKDNPHLGFLFHNTWLCWIVSAVIYGLAQLLLFGTQYAWWIFFWQIGTIMILFMSLVMAINKDENGLLISTAYLLIVNLIMLFGASYKINSGFWMYIPGVLFYGYLFNDVYRHSSFKKNRDLVRKLHDAQMKQLEWMDKNGGISAHLCPECAEPLPDQAKFCPKCGASIPDDTMVQCPKCHSLVPADETFCHVCGSRLQPEGAKRKGLIAKAKEHHEAQAAKKAEASAKTPASEKAEGSESVKMTEPAKEELTETKSAPDADKAELVKENKGVKAPETKPDKKPEIETLAEKPVTEPAKDESTPEAK